MMKVIKTIFRDSYIFEPSIFRDKRGFFYESYRVKEISKYIGKKNKFVQENFSISKKGVLRGLHFQKKKPQGKLIYVLKGKIFDVIVDLRKKSSTYGVMQSFNLDDKKHRMLWVPPGFAHGFLAMSNNTYVCYKCTEYYYPNDQRTLIWNDKDLKIKWPGNIKYIISKKDLDGKKIKFLKLCKFLFYVIIVNYEKL